MSSAETVRVSIEQALLVRTKISARGRLLDCVLGMNAIVACVRVLFPVRRFHVIRSRKFSARRCKSDGYVQVLPESIRATGSWRCQVRLEVGLSAVAPQKFRCPSASTF